MRYRCEAGSSSRARSRYHNVHRLGRITKIKGYRFRSTRGTGDSKWTTKHERVMVYGVNGTARFDGVCWGYGGEGPCALRELLILCGVDKATAEKVAHEARRQDECGTDWTITLETTAQVTAEYGFETPKQADDRLVRVGQPTKPIEWMEMGTAKAS